MALLDTSIHRRDFLKGGLASATALSLAGLGGCAPGGSGDSEGGQLASTNLKPHVVDSDTAILNNEGEWIAVECPWNCGGVRCINYEYVVDGVPIRHKTADDVEDSEELPQLRACPRGSAHRQVVFNADRIKYPMKRKSWQPGGGENSHGELRGVDEWERITWDEALDLVASELTRVYEQYGPKSVLNIGYGVDSILGMLGGCMTIDYTASAGNFIMASNNIGFDYHGGNAAMSSANDRTDLVNADTIILYGSDPVWANGGNVAYYYKLAQEKGVDFVFVGPNYSQSANLLDARWVQVRPGTDTAFLLGVAYEMLRMDSEGKNLIDWDFLHKYCVGFDAESMPQDAKLNENFKDYVLGAYDGQPKTPEWATEICGTPVEDISWFAELVGKNNDVMILHSYAAARYNGSEDYPQLILTVGCMGGHMGRSGNACGNGFSYQGANSGAALVDYGAPSASAAPVANGVEKSLIGGPELWESVVKGQYTYRGNGGMGIPHGFALEPEEVIPLDIKLFFTGVYVNRLQTMMSVPYGIEAMRKVECVIMTDCRNSFTASFADILLPSTTTWEGNLDKSKGDLNLASQFLFLQASQHDRDHILIPRPCTLPLYEAKPEEWIRIELMKRLGQDWESQYPINAVQRYFDMLAGATFVGEEGLTLDYLSEAEGDSSGNWADVRTSTRNDKLITITQEDIDAWGVTGEPQEGLVGLQELLAKGYYQVPRSANDNKGYYGYQLFIENPEANPRPSTSGKFEIYCQEKADGINVTGFARSEMKPYPTYRESRHSYVDSFSDWSSKQKGEFPFQLYEPHYLRRAHTAFDESVVLQEAFQNPIFMNASDAAALGIKTGDTVLIASKTGKILRKASLTQRLMPGVVALPHGARSDYDHELGIDRGGNDNTLTSSEQGSEWFPQCECYNSLLVSIEKYSEEIPNDFEKEPFALLKEE